jgi:hypothetical protein
MLLGAVLILVGLCVPLYFYGDVARCPQKADN